MQIIEFSVINQRVRCESETGIIANSRGLVHASFVFDAEWEGCGITVTFDNTEYSGEPISQGWTGEAIEIPPEVLIPGQLLISCVGIKNEGTFRIPTYEMRPGVKIYQSGHLFGIMPDSVTPNMVEQLMAAAGKAIEAASAAEQTAADLEAARNNGEFTGPAGPSVAVEYDVETGTVRLVNPENSEGSEEATPVAKTEVLTVNVVNSGGSLTADKTYAEIQDAAQSGKLVQARHEGCTYMLGYADPNDSNLEFGFMWGPYLKFVKITNANAVTAGVITFKT